MKIALIPPIPDLKTFELESKCHLLLAHLFESNKYRNHYFYRRKQGDYLIVDNGACEHDRPTSMANVMDCAVQVRAQEVVIPDVQFDASETLAELRKSLRWLITDRPTWIPKFQFVPQGQTPQEWMDCLDRGILLLKSAGIDPVVAVAKQYEEFPEGRLALVRALQTRDLDEVHLLGWAPPWESLARIAQECPWVRSVDSAKPFSYAKHGVKLELGKPTHRIPRDDNYFQTRVPVQHDLLARTNVNTFRQAAMAA